MFSLKILPNAIQVTVVTPNTGNIPSNIPIEMAIESSLTDLPSLSKSIINFLNLLKAEAINGSQSKAFSGAQVFL